MIRVSRGCAAISRACGPISGAARLNAANCRGAGGPPAVVAALVASAVFAAGAALAKLVYESDTAVQAE